MTVLVRAVMLPVLLLACAHTPEGRCAEVIGSPNDSLYARPVDSIPPFSFDVRWSALRNTSDGTQYVALTGRGPRSVVDGRRADGQINGCLTIEPSDDCPAVSAWALLEYARTLLAEQHISPPTTLLRDQPSEAGVWAIVVSDWHHVDSAVRALATALGIARVDATMAVAVGPPGCVQYASRALPRNETVGSVGAR